MHPSHKSLLLKRLKTHFRFRIVPLSKWYEKKVVGPFRARRGVLSRQLLYPASLFSPRWKSEVHVARPSALGDVLMCTPALREFKNKNPKTKIYFYTHYPELVRGLPYIDEVAFYEERPWDCIELRYEESLPPIRHVAEIFGDQLDVVVKDIHPECVFPKSETIRIREVYQHLPRPWILINQKAGPWTPNKDWSEENWNKLIPKLLELGTVFQIGTENSYPSNHSFNYINLCGKTSLSEMIAVISVADITIGPVSGPIHIAAAAKIPSVVIYGGYESEACSGYSYNINLTTVPECSPCWLRTPCPENKKCLAAISPEQVLEATSEILLERQLLKKPKSHQENNWRERHAESVI